MGGLVGSRPVILSPAKGRPVAHHRVILPEVTMSPCHHPMLCIETMPASASSCHRVTASQWRQWPGRRWPWLLLALVTLVAIWLVGRILFRSSDPTWARIQESGVWRVGMDPSFPPFEELDGGSGQPVGLDVDLARAIAARWGVRAEFAGVGFDQLIDVVAAHRVDSAISALPIIDYRAKDVAFSAPYIEAGVILAVPPGSAIAGPDDLAGRRVAVEWGSAGDAQARTIQQKLGADVELVLRESVDAALGAVVTGDADAAIVDAVSLALFNRAGHDLIIVGEPLQPDPYVVVVPVDAPDLLGAVNETLAALEQDGTLAELKARWLSAESP